MAATETVPQGFEPDLVPDGFEPDAPDGFDPDPPSFQRSVTPEIRTDDTLAAFRKQSSAQMLSPKISPPSQKEMLASEQSRIANQSAPAITKVAAKVASGLEKGMAMPERAIRGGLDFLGFYGALDATLGTGTKYQDYNRGWLEYFNKRERRLSKEDADLGATGFGYDAAEGVARAATELPTQLLGGAAGAARGAAVKGAAITAGAIGGLSQYAQDRGSGKDKTEAAIYGGVSGAITGLTTAAFGATGVESVFKSEGVRGVRSRLLNVLKQAGFEGAEESVDQFQQDLLERTARNPNKPIGESVREVLLSGSVGTLIGGAASSLSELGGGGMETETAPVPELSATLAAQLKLVQAGTKPAMLVTPGETMPSVPEGFSVLPAGTRGQVVFDSKKITPKQVTDLLAHGEEGVSELLGLGATKEQAVATGPVAALETKVDGVPVQQEVVSPATLPAAVDASKKTVPDGEIELKSSDQIIKERKLGGAEADLPTAQREQSRRNNEAQAELMRKELEAMGLKFPEPVRAENAPTPSSVTQVEPPRASSVTGQLIPDAKTEPSGIIRVTYRDAKGNEVGYGQLDGKVINMVSVKEPFQSRGYGAQIIKDLRERGGLYGVVGTQEGLALMRSKSVGAREYEPNKFTFEPEQPTPPAKPSEVAGAEVVESRVRLKPESFDPFTAEEGDLADFFEERFGQQPRGGVAGEARGVPAFRDYNEFRDWMEKAYSAADLDALKTGFALADTKLKIQFIRDNKSADATKRELIAHLTTGAPLPAGFKPATPAAPQPMPGTVPSTPPPARPGQPPPPPRPTPNTPGHRKFDITALVQLFRQFSKFPTVNERLMQAYGRFIPGTNSVEMKARLMWDTKLAERVLGHEIGHFIDLAVAAMGKGKQFAKRLIPLWDLRHQVWTKTELKNEARSLSRQWRGPFTNGDRYRDSAKELFADYMSAMFNNPEMVNHEYPKLFDAFQKLRDGKPQFADAYREVETWLQGDTMVDEIRVQDKAAVNRTFDELQNPRKPSKASFADRLKFATLSLWQRAFEKEGKPRKLGDSITDELEYNKTWAAKENALFADDFSKLVRPELEKVNPDPVQARSDLLSYSKAVRTIGERRAAGVWIKQHPQEAFDMLQEILNLDPSLKSKWQLELDAIGQGGNLYDLSAAIFREIHDRGEPFVNRMTRTIDELDLGVDGEAALMAFNVRGKLLNPGGMTVENSQKMIDRLQNDLGPVRFDALETAAKNLRDLLHDVQNKMHDEGLISDKVWKELIEPNKDNYLPYAVLDYFDGKVRAGVMTQKGTSKDIADIAAATQLKVASSNVWRQQQRQVKLLRDVETIAQRGPVPVGEKLKRSRDIEQVREKHRNDDVSRAVYWVNGKPHVAEFPGDPGKMLEKAMDVPSFYEHIEWIGEASDMTHKVMQIYTQFSVPFLFWRNPIRGARTTGLKVGYGRVGQQMLPGELKTNLKLAKNYADAAFGGEMLPEIRDLVDRQILLPPRLSQAMVRDSANLRDLLANHTVLANQVRGLHPDAQPRWWKGGAIGRKGIEVSEKVFTAYEAFEKIYNYKAAIEKGLTPEQAGAVSRRAGIPKPGVGGKWSLAMEVWLPWTRVHIQGTRATYDMLRDPTMRKGFATRFMLTEAMPRVAKVAIGTGVVSGVISWVIGDHEDDPEDGVMAEFMRRVSPYKMALDDTVPLYFYDARTGKVHYLWEFKNGKSVPKHYEAISLRIPASEEGRMWGVLLYNTMVSTPRVSDKLGKTGETFVSNMGNWAVNYAAPGLSPIITTTSNLKDMILLGRNPKDSYRNQPAANPQLFDAGGVDRAQAVAGYTMNQLGSAGELAGVMAANFGLLDERALNALSTRLPGDYRQWNEKVPFLKTAVSHDNYAQYREEQIPKLEEERIRAKSRLVMSPDSRALYDFYYRNLNRKDRLTDSELEQFQASNYFVNQIWGKLTVNKEPNPDSFYSKAAHAVGKDGSRQAKATVQRDLDAAAAEALAAFKEARKK